VETIQSAFQSGAFQGVTVLLNAPDDIASLNSEVANHPGLPVSAWGERDYFATQSRILGNTLFAIGFSVGMIMSLGAIFGALNTMYSAISVRSLEIATLRAIGFTGFSVAVSVLIEAMVLAIVGALFGCLSSWLILHSQTISMLNGGGTQVVFSAVFDLKLALAGTTLALAIGFIGGLAPAFRAASLPVSVVLRVS
jgi:putative ABC transport system permease protein